MLNESHFRGGKESERSAAPFLLVDIPELNIPKVH